MRMASKLSVTHNLARIVLERGHAPPAEQLIASSCPQVFNEAWLVESSRL